MVVDEASMVRTRRLAARSATREELDEILERDRFRRWVTGGGAQEYVASIRARCLVDS